MIPDEQFALEHQDDLLEKYPSINQPLLEKSLYAFELLGHLAESGAEFVFKGGTSLLLLLPELQRLSIDIDLVGQVPEDVLEEVVANSRFLDMENIPLTNQSGGSIPLRRYYFYYHSEWAEEEDHVQLDILEDQHVYPEVKKVPIKTELFDTGDNVQVYIPSRASLLADKLTAFAPETIGIPYNPRPLRLAKQMYDVATLAGHVEDFATLKKSYERIYQKECEYKNVSFTLEDCLMDSIRAAFLVTQKRLPETQEPQKFNAISQGIDRLENYLVKGGFSETEAVLMASRAALVPAWLLSEDPDPSFMTDDYDPDMLQDADITGELSPVNHLKKTHIEAFANWYRVHEGLQSQ